MMSLDYALGGAAALIVLAYLIVALLRPEKF
jgi:K+-transporting ATPase KdpF subunit